VFNAGMLPARHALLACTAVLGWLLVASPASARIIEVGQSATPATPTCPANPCLAVSRTTGYQAKVVDSRDVFVIPRAGKIVAFTISLGKPNRRQIEFFDENFGAASAGISVLRRGERLFGRVVTQSPVYQLSDYFGQTVQFPLSRALNVKRGYVLALTVPTWAPALTGLLDDGSSWRASRPLNGCDDTDRQTAQRTLGALTQYRCLYKARLTYSATLVTTPKPNAPPRQRRG
jgi:hypothetical protein